MAYYPFFLQLFMLSYQQVLRIVDFLILVQIEKKLLRYADATFNHKNGFVYYIGIFVQCEI